MLTHYTTTATLVRTYVRTNYFLVESATTGVAVESTLTESFAVAVESATLIAAVLLLPHAVIPIARINVIAPTLAALKIVDKRFALYNALVV